MPNSMRAKQFAPFDALKGLRDALKIKEYEHDRVVKGDILEEKVREISNTLIKISNGDRVELTIFDDGYKTFRGSAKINPYSKQIKINDYSFSFDDIFNICIIDKE